MPAFVRQLLPVVLGLCQAALVPALWSPASPALGGSFQVSPIRIQMSVRERAAALHLSNPGDQALTLHAEVMRWTQDATGADVLEPSNDLVLSPPVIVLPAGVQQVVRLARLTPVTAGEGQSYRLIVRETMREATDPPAIGQVPVLLALSIPVFLMPAQPERRLTCEHQTTTDSGVVLVCHNEGNVFVRVLRAEIGPRAQPLAQFAGAAYWLPNSQHRLHLKSEGPVARGTHVLTVWLDDGQSQSLNVTLH